MTKWRIGFETDGVRREAGSIFPLCSGMVGPDASFGPVAKKYNARDVVLAEWVKGRSVRFYGLLKSHRDPKNVWGEVDPGVLFR